MSSKKEEVPVEDKTEELSKTGKIVVFAVIVLGALLTFGSLGIAFNKYYGKDVVSIPKGIPEVLIPSEADVGDDIPTLVTEEGLKSLGKPAAPVIVEVKEVVKPSTKPDDYSSHRISCTVLAGNITEEIARGAARRGCDYLEVPYINTIRLCNAVTKDCNEIFEQDL